MLWGSLQHPIWAQGKSLVYKLFAGDLAADYGSFDAILPVIPPACARTPVSLAVTRSCKGQYQHAGGCCRAASPAPTIAPDSFAWAHRARP